MRRGWFAALLALATTVVLLFLTLPVVAVFVDRSPGELVDSLGEEGVLDALWLSLKTTAIALAITLVELPLVLPPAVAGIALLATFAPNGILGGALEDAGIEIPLTTTAVVLALTFVASPFYVRQAQAAFEAVDRTLVDASRTLGASEARTFLRVVVPSAANGLLAGGALALGRALGEFGATLMFAGSFRGVTQTAPLAIYDRFATQFEAALALSAVLVAVSGGILLSVKALGDARP